MKRKYVMPTKPFVGATAMTSAEKRPRERRTLGLKFELVSGESVSGLR